MTKLHRIIIFTTGGLLAAGLVFMIIRNGAAQKKVRTLTVQVSSLEQQLEDAKEENSELEEQLASVQHFDDDASSGDGFQAGAINFTGDVIETSIDGDFEGWEGETIFKMMNGTIWQQASYDYTYHYAYMPDVIIYKKGGIYYIKVEDVDDEIQVRRIR